MAWFYLASLVYILDNVRMFSNFNCINIIIQQYKIAINSYKYKLKKAFIFLHLKWYKGKIYKLLLFTHIYVLRLLTMIIPPIQNWYFKLHRSSKKKSRK